MICDGTDDAVLVMMDFFIFLKSYGILDYGNARFGSNIVAWFCFVSFIVDGTVCVMMWFMYIFWGPRCIMYISCTSQMPVIECAAMTVLLSVLISIMRRSEHGQNDEPEYHYSHFSIESTLTHWGSMIF